MAGPLHIDGRQIGELRLQRRPPDQTCDRVSLFRDGDGAITLLVVALQGRQSAGDAGATVTATVYEDVDELRAVVQHRWPGGWWEVLDQSHAEDARLYREWAPQRIERDLHSDETSLWNRDLATTTGYFGGQPIAASGRQLDAWQADAAAAMADHLRRLGWLVHPDGHEVCVGLHGCHEVVGGLRLWRYGWEALAIVRVDCCGEVFVRLADVDPRELTEDESEHARGLWETQRLWMRLQG